MCGIFFSCSRQTPILPCKIICEYLNRRGPDSFNTIHREFDEESLHIAPHFPNSKISLTFAASVLSLRGNSLTEQPLEDLQTGSIFCWNGEAWKIKDGVCEGNDAKLVFDVLLEAIKSNATSSSVDDAVMSAFHNVSGPSAFVFYDGLRHKIFYGRDRLGRRSLLQSVDSDGALIISSICHPAQFETWTEVKSGWMYILDLAEYARRGPLQAVVSRNGQSLNNQSQNSASDEFGNIWPEGLHSVKFPEPYLNKDTIFSPLPRLDLDSTAVSMLAEKLLRSISLRVQDIPLPSSAPITRPRVAILFSGGLDCTILARLIHDVLPLAQEVDLLNVAFENPRVLKSSGIDFSDSISPLPSAFSICPDRKTGLSALAELTCVCPGRRWRFISVNVPYAETLKSRPQIVSLIHPHNTQMDLSIACALYFAARGSGHICDQEIESVVSYNTPARVLLSGLGADELFAGYRRHAISFAHRGYQGLVDELELDFNRLGERNLGRDDRAISHWGREVRYPYLDEDLVDWAIGLPVVSKCGFGQSQSVNEHPCLEPGKKILRLLAWKLGLEATAVEKKRAIQFGSRTAKMEMGSTKGHQLIS